MMRTWLRNVGPNRCTACIYRLLPSEGVGIRDRASSVDGKSGRNVTATGRDQTYSPSVVRYEVVFLPQWAHSRDFTVCIPYETQ